MTMVRVAVCVGAGVALAEGVGVVLSLPHPASIRLVELSAISAARMFMVLPLFV
jgi:hypothetical protein